MYNSVMYTIVSKLATFFELIMTNSVKKHIVLPYELYEMAQTKAKKFGFRLGEYVRYVIARDVEEDIPMVDEETEKEIGIALKEYKEGKYVTIHNRDELRKFLGIDK